MIRKYLRQENYSRQEKEFIVRYVHKNRCILEDKSRFNEVFLKKRDKWRELTKNLKKICGVMRDWNEVRRSYQSWKTLAKKNIAAFRKCGDNVPKHLAPTEFDYIIYNICPQDFKDDENLSKECKNNRVTSENDELSNASHSFVGNSELCHNVVHTPQSIKRSTEHTDEILDNSKIKLEPQIDEVNIEDSPNAYEETRNHIRCPSINTSINSTNFADRLGEFVTSNTVEPARKRQRINSVNSDRETDDGISHNVDNDDEFRQQENILKLAILRVQLDREEKESKIRMKQEKVKLNILKLQLKRKSAFLTMSSFS